MRASAAPVCRARRTGARLGTFLGEIRQSCIAVVATSGGYNFEQS